MRRKDKPFVLYSRGPLSFTIVPRGFSGWLQFALWLALLVPPLFWFEHHINAPEEVGSAAAVVLLFCLFLLVWAVGGLWWICAHAEVINMSKHLRDKQRARRRARLRDKGEE